MDLSLNKAVHETVQSGKLPRSGASRQLTAPAGRTGFHATSSSLFAPSRAKAALAEP